MSNIEEHIRKAIEEGQFDNLPGKGKPLKLDENPHEDPEWRLAHTMLKNSGFSLPWIETRREIEEALEKSASDLYIAWARRGQEMLRHPAFESVQDEWQRAAAAYQQQVAEINKKILVYNLQAPSPRFHLLAINADREIARVTQAG